MAVALSASGGVLGNKMGRKLVMGIIGEPVYVWLIFSLFDHFVLWGVAPPLSAILSVAAMTGGVAVAVTVAVAMP